MPAKKPYKKKPSAEKLGPLTREAGKALEKAVPGERRTLLLKQAANIYSKKHDIEKLELIARKLIGLMDLDAAKRIYGRCAGLYERQEKLGDAARCYERAFKYGDARRLYLAIGDKPNAERVWLQMKRQKQAKKKR